jgi:hypothetical protein
LLATLFHRHRERLLSSSRTTAHFRLFAINLLHPAAIC